MRPRGLSVTLKIFLGTALVIVVVVGVTLAVTTAFATRAANDSVGRVLSSAREAMGTQLTARATTLRGAAEVFALNPRFRSIVESRAFTDVLDQAAVAEVSLGASWVQIVDAEGIRMAKSDEPGAAADTLSGSPVIGAALEGESVVAFGVTGDTVLIQITAVPIEGAGRIVGALMVAKNVDSTFAASVKRQAATDVDVVFSFLDQDDEPLVSGSTLGRTDEVITALKAFHALAGDSASDARVDAEIGGIHFVGLGEVLRSAGGTPLGGFVMLRNRDAEFATFARLQEAILLSGGIGILVAALLSLLLARQITRPLGRLVEATKRATDGDYATQIPIQSRDEIGTLAGAFRALLADLREKQQLVEFLGGTDSTRTVQMKVLSATSEQRVQAGGIVPGAKFAGRYEVKEVLGEGGMGTVYRALDAELHEVIAIKTLKKDFLSQDPTALDRFKEEIRLARRISHRNVVRTHDLGENSGVYFITMEYVEGTSLKELIRARGRLPLNIALSVGKQLARALEVAHEQGIIHRDIKPANIVVEADGVLKVMDFGIARLAVRKPESGVTQAGMIVGTPEYMAPEQVAGGEVDQRVDIYAAGCVLYECLTGRAPLTGETPYQLIAKLLEDMPQSPRAINPEIPPALEALIMRALAKDPAARPQSAVELHDRLAEIG
ncbi:MAG: protein kinase [Gemmatimonadales bacterium]|nr:protein kinase [Gemmatimonadota bacterium]MCL4213932.1 protein kinase [Gemmatimonadales bacterium]